MNRIHDDPTNMGGVIDILEGRADIEGAGQAEGMGQEELCAVGQWQVLSPVLCMEPPRSSVQAGGCLASSQLCRRGLGGPGGQQTYKGSTVCPCLNED